MNFLTVFCGEKGRLDKSRSDERDQDKSKQNTVKQGFTTDSIKINRPDYYIRMHWTKFWQPTVHVQQNIFEVGSSHIYSDSKKHESSCLLSDFFSCISPEPLELQKSYFHQFASLSEELSDEKRIFQIRLQNQLIFAKTLFCQKKVSYFETFKNVFAWI